MKTPKIIIAPDSFKNSIDAFSISEIISQELKKYIDCEVEILPIGDGGDGTAAVIAKALNAKKIDLTSYDPLKRGILSPVWFLDDKAIVEMADVSGLRLLKNDEKDPVLASSGGLGLLINKVVDKGLQHIILCIGGSATIDMGVGALKELGIKFLDSKGHEISEINVTDFKRIERIDVSSTDYLKDVRIDILCDVENPLLGENGAIRVYGSQKGVLSENIEELIENHTHLASIIEKVTGINIAGMKYSGAAGGISASFHALLGANLYKGADYILDLLDFDRKIKDCDILITGEGRMDSQTNFGKAPFMVAERARKYCKKIIAINGQTECLSPLFDKSFSLKEYSNSVEDSMFDPAKYLRLLIKDLSNYINNVI
jgi:glycerate kinase